MKMRGIKVGTHVVIDNLIQADHDKNTIWVGAVGEVLGLSYDSREVQLFFKNDVKFFLGVNWWVKLRDVSPTKRPITTIHPSNKTLKKNGY